MIINKENYELYAVDYMDGNLSGKEKLEMEQFLSENPDIKAELEELGVVVLIPDERVVYENKSTLLRTPKNHRFGWMTAFILLFFISTTIVFWYQHSHKTTENVVEYAPEDQKLNNLPNAEEQEINRVEHTQKAVTEKKPENVINTNVSSDLSADKKNIFQQPINQATNNNNTSGKSQTFEPNHEIGKFPNESKAGTIENGKTQDSIKTEIQKPLPKPIPMAVLEPKQLPLEYNFDDKMLDTGNQKATEIANSTAFAQKKPTTKPKGVKTPFGRIQFSEIAEALLPESYIASK